MDLRARRNTTTWIMAGLAAMLSLPGTVVGASPGSFAGQILGHVQDATGVAQMGATVYLYNRYDQLVQHALTNEQGRFAFDALTPDLYSLRVLLASFAPAERRNISVLPNSENRLEISLATVLSTVTLAPPSQSRGTLMTDDWKWVLRSSQATRPVLRFLPEAAASASRTLASSFSNTTGIVKLSAGDGQSFAQGAQEDLGTAFALATSLAGSGRVQLSGNVGYNGNNFATPGAGLRTSYSRSSAGGSSPEVVLTLHQLYMAPRNGSGVAMGTDGAPPLRTMSVAVLDSIDVAENVRLDYGFDYQSVSYLDRLNYVSPFVRTTVDAGSQGRVRLAYSSGAPPAELLARDEAMSGSLDQDLAALALVPRISLSDGHAVVERTQDFEIGYERVEDTRAWTAGAYREVVSNAAFMLSSPQAGMPAGDLMPDLNSNSSILNAGSYQRTGFDAAVKQRIGDRVELAAAAGGAGALVAAPGGAPSASMDSRSLRAGISQKQVAWATLRASAKIPVAGTRVVADYGWTDPRALVPTHLFVTQNVNQDIGVNLRVRQPLPLALPWRMELTAELRNLLAQGYLPLGTAVPRSVLTTSPRAVRGGLNFIF
ncbi:MAG TPA: carboxypeptidase-like regulatory domain-containing protein [Bryobacteraceae bacterium]|nr:carboxypeptidase-like regulatory domain-containing protein [Bryobacteraceae bacterium]